MSQEKVARYKEEKANRKTMMKKEKRKQFFRKCVVGVVAIGLIGWIGYSAYNMYESSRPRQMAEVDYSEIDSYIESLNGTETE